MPKSTEPANAHYHFTTHMPIAYEWQHPRSPVHDPPSREIDQGAEETMNEATPQPLGTRKQTHPKGHDRSTLFIASTYTSSVSIAPPQGIVARYRDLVLGSLGSVLLHA